MHLRQIYSPIRSADNPGHTDSHDEPTRHSYLHAVALFLDESGCDLRKGLWNIQQPNPHKTVRYLQRHGDVGIVVDSCYYYTIFTIKSQVVKNPPKCASVRGRVGMWLFGYSFIVWWPIFPRLVGPWPCVGQLDCCRYCPWHSSDPFGQWLDLHQLLAL